MRIGISLKFWFFTHYWWILLLTVVLTVAGLLWRNENLTTVVTLVGSLLSLLYFLQKQKLEELHLFRALFKEFNERYDTLNEKLALIAEEKSADLSTKECETLIDYFNLCGEEYLYFTKGYIDPAVWNAWHKGMNALVSVPRIRKLWLAEKLTDSYYGLPL
mgnify:CR=1 FL=1